MKRTLPTAAALRPAGARLIVVSLLALVGVFGARSSRAVALSVYGQLPSIENVALSPDGTRVAFVRTEGDLRVVFVANVADRKVIRYVKAGDTKLRDIEWADNDNLMITTSVTTSVYGFKDEWYLLRVYNVPKNELRSLPGNTLGAMNDVMNTVVGPVSVRRMNGHTVLFVPGLYVSGPDTGWAVEGDDVALFRCDLATGITGLVKKGPVDVSWLIDGQGRLVAQENYDRQTQRWSIGVSLSGGDPSQAAAGHAPLDYPHFRGLGPMPDTALVESTEHGDRVWSLLSIKDRKLSPMPESDVFDRPLHDELTGQMIGGINIVDYPQYVFFDPARNASWQAIVKAFEGNQVQYISASSDFSKVVVLVQGPKYGYRYVLIDLGKPAAFPLGKAYAGIDAPLEVRPITYPAGDGLEIHAYLTLPGSAGPEARARRAAPRRACGEGYRRIQLVGAGSRRPGLRRPAAELSRLQCQ